MAKKANDELTVLVEDHPDANSDIFDAESDFGLAVRNEFNVPDGTPKTAKAYWAGVLMRNECPFQNFSVMGMTFHHYTDKVIQDDITLTTKREKRNGHIHFLTKDQAKQIREEISHLWARKRGVTTKIVDDREKGFVSHKGDMPVGQWLYLVLVDEVAEKFGPIWRTRAPETLTEKS